MAQFDSLIIFPLVWSLLLALSIHYRIALKRLIPDFVGIRKFRAKRLNPFTFLEFFTKSSKVIINKSYEKTY